MSWKRWLHVVIWLSLLAGGMVAGGVALRFYRSEPARLPAPGTLAPLPAPEAEARVRTLREEVQRVGEAVQKSRPASFTLRLRDEDLNAHFAAHPEELRALTSDLRQVRFQFGSGGSVAVQALGTYRGREVVLRVKGQVRLDPGQGLHFKIQEGRLGAFPLPPRLRTKLAEEINQGLSQNMKKIPSQVRLETLSSEDGELTLQGRVIPEER